MANEIQKKFTAPASKIWNTIPIDGQNELLENAWCSRCRHEVKLTEYSGSIKNGNLVLVGACADCNGDASRIVELKRSVDDVTGTKRMHVVLGKPRLSWAQAYIENELVKIDSKLREKRIRELMKKNNNGTITRIEEKELSRIGNDHLRPLLAWTIRFGESFEF